MRKHKKEGKCVMSKSLANANDAEDRVQYENLQGSGRDILCFGLYIRVAWYADDHSADD